ncbi:DUF2812 domain-containing protein [Solibacillus sp. MA9]|uniref:DUF2812 domain-containing protein n=1 Tax=Solibacillus palustris TaxID=2908203 RepID=A0ABS9UBH2_9BACL|nr:DUF2812 domain-containing protein [Solibacillus sp. MA9]MCH7321568.1 DUF2812 domain-containing protein [Solibacillus sp. MA9]
MRVFKLILDDVKEEQWLNDMASQGLHFQKFRFPFYTFEKGEPGEYVYRTEMLENLGFGQETKNYLAFIESTGIEVVQKRFSWAYFRQHQSKGAFELYSDAASKLAYTNRIYAIYAMIFGLNIAAALMNGAISYADASADANSFLAGLSTGVSVVILYPTLKTFFRRRNLKKEIELFEL